MKQKVRFTLLALIIVFLILFSKATGLYVDWLFFDETGYQQVFTKTLSTQFLAGLCFGLFTFIIILANIILVNRIKPPTVSVSLDGSDAFSFNLNTLGKFSKLFGLLAALFMGIFGTLWGVSLWKQLLLYFNGTSAGLQDPILGKDIGFYFFTLPLYQSFSSFLGFLLFVSIVITVIGYSMRGGFFISGSNISIAKEARRHVGVLIGLVLIKTAFGFYLDRFELLYTAHGIIVGAGYTDVHAKLFMLNVMIVVSVIAGILFVAGFMREKWKIALYPIGGVVAIYILGVVIYPGLLQNFKVAPNELAMERPYIKNHIALTRYGFDLEKVDLRPFNVSYNLTAKDIQQNDTTIKNIRLWDESPLLTTFSQLQQIRTYYRFTGIDNARYMLDGGYRQVMLSPRELSYDDLPSKSWINEKLVFTHGNGVSMAHVSKISPEGLPEFIVKDIPPSSSSKDITITRPEIYFGEIAGSYAIANTKIPEFNYPTAEGNVYGSYKGVGGVPISSLSRKALFAAHFREAKIFLSSDIREGSRILYYRNIVERIQKIAPFLYLDQDPYIVVSSDGKLYWIIDAYTVSSLLPYSKQLNNRVNYMRNSVKITVDAYDGKVHFYLNDPGDPLVQTYRAIFPDLLKDMSEMPPDLKKHIRYPRDLFRIQALMYATYHMEDPKTFYNKEDLWEIPSHNDKQMQPYYLIMKLPGEKKEEYVLLVPYTPAKRDNLAAWFAASCDDPDYGKLIVYSFPRDRLIFGPRQIDARIDQDSYISQQLTLWGQRGSQVIRGNLLIIPIESALLYIQPLYLAAEDKGGLPELRRVIVAYENNVVMEESLELAFQQIFGARRGPAPAEAQKQQQTFTINDLAKEANRIFEKMIQLQRQGDWSGYGDNLKKLEKILREMTAK